MQQPEISIHPLIGRLRSLNATPELMSFKLYSLTKRGQAYHMPMEIQSNFLAK